MWLKYARFLYSARQESRNPNVTVSDGLLMWCFCHCVLTNMKGAGERRWDLDPDGGDATDMIPAHEDTPEIMHIELGNRLGPYVEG